ncbi:MAG TPA: cation diffusion facilitator family transporter [Ornithinibacter sp.]|nr:cation diffusion facilitator family transporter [Ornithinibacter sp.]
MSSEGGTRAVIAALLANLGIAVTKFVAFFLTGFSSMLAEAIHSVADSGNQILLLIGGKRSRQEATPTHPFGFGRERYVYSFVVSIVLFTLGGCFALYEAWHKFRETRGDADYDPFESQWWWVPVVVLVVAIGLEGFSFRTAVRESNKVRGKRSWLRFVRSSKAPELPVILLEDFGALIGLTLALSGVGLMLITGNPIFDVLGSGSIGVLLVLIAAFLAIEMNSLLVGESATTAHQKAILDALAAPAGVERVIHAKTLHLGPEELLVAAKLAVAPTDRARDVAAAIDEAERRARDAVPDLTLVMYLEPDVDHGDVQVPADRPEPPAPGGH